MSVFKPLVADGHGDFDWVRMPSVSSMEIGHDGAGLPVRMIHRHPIIGVEDFGESGIERHEAWKIRCAAERRMGLPPWPRALDWVPGFEVLATNPYRLPQHWTPVLHDFQFRVFRRVLEQRISEDKP